jgi:hypothetical protein
LLVNLQATGNETALDQKLPDISWIAGRAPEPALQINLILPTPKGYAILSGKPLYRNSDDGNQIVAIFKI